MRVERGKMCRATWEALKAHIMRDRKRKRDGERPLRFLSIDPLDSSNRMWSETLLNDGLGCMPAFFTVCLTVLYKNVPLLAILYFDELSAWLSVVSFIANLERQVER